MKNYIRIYIRMIFQITYLSWIPDQDDIELTNLLFRRKTI